MESWYSLKQSILMLSLTSLGLASLLPSHLRSKTSTHYLYTRDGEAWPYGVIGDSWGSGVSYNDDVLYDNNRDMCMRTKESHGPQMEADQGWVGHDPSGLRDAACSGSKLVDIVVRQHQMGKVGDSPAMVVMTSGGNDAGFGTIVDECIYHSNPLQNYGPAFGDDPNGEGLCAGALNDATKYITDPTQMQLDLTKTLDDLFNDPASKNPDFLLYLTGYAQFFGTDYDPWCNTEYWSVPNLNPGTGTPYLTVSLRQAFNNRVSAVNNLYKSVAESDKYKDKVRYIDIDTPFGGHRFCEPGSNHQDQLNTDTNFDKVYLWNLNWSWQVTGQGAPSAAAAAGNPSAQEAQAAFNGGGVTAWSGSGSGGSGSSGGGPDNLPQNGWRLRPFHPRYTGYTAIKEAIFAQLKADGLPKAQSATPTVSCSHAADPQNTCPAVADSKGWCDCGDGKQYISQTTGDPCAWTTLPATTSFDCGAPASPATPTPSVNLNSPDCQTCTTNLGASSCAATDNQCLVNQCKGDTSCQACQIDCSTFGS